MCPHLMCFQSLTVITKHTEISIDSGPFLLRVILRVCSQLYLFQQEKKIPNVLLNTAWRLRVISSIITILFVKREGLKMTGASILDDVSERNVAPHYQMVLLSEALQSLSNIPFS